MAINTQEQQRGDPNNEGDQQEEASQEAITRVAARICRVSSSLPRES